MPNRYAAFGSPDATLDFHGRPGLTAGAVKREVEAFVRAAHRRGDRRLRIVTGKGLHSKAAPIVAPQARRTLEALRREGLVRTFCTESLVGGGDGALRVDLEPA